VEVTEAALKAVAAQEVAVRVALRAVVMALAAKAVAMAATMAVKVGLMVDTREVATAKPQCSAQ